MKSCIKCGKEHLGIPKTCAGCLDKNSKWALNNKDKRSRYSKKWASTDNAKEIMLKASAKYRANHKNNEEHKRMVNLVRAKSTAKAVSCISERYVKSIIISGMPERVSSLRIPKEIVDAKREDIKLKRLIKEMKK